MAAQQRQIDTLKLSDGSSMTLARLSDIDDQTWNEVKTYLEGNPEMAKSLKNIADDPLGVRSWFQTQAIAQYYASNKGDNQMKEAFKAMENDPELKPIFEKMKTDGKDGIVAAFKACQDDELMVKLSKKMGGIPPELLSILQKLQGTSMTIHEACKRGDIASIKACLANGPAANEPDNKGISPLGYAIGAGKGDAVQLLLESAANPLSVDSNGNSGLHYASGYGRLELVEVLLKAKANVNQANAQGQTPLALATVNNRTSMIAALQQHGATA
jgi:hypothetical protein